MSKIGADFEAESDEKNIPSHVEDTDYRQVGTLDTVLGKGLEHTVLEDRQTAFELALKSDPGPPRWSWRNIRFYLIVFLMCLATGDLGFDSTLIGSVNSMPQYQSYFDLQGESSTKTGVVFGIGAAGILAAWVPSYYVPDRFGRRWALFAGHIPAIVGNILSGCASNYQILLAARVIGSMGFSGSAPVAYLAEICPVQSRGRILGFYSASYYIGQILATGISIPFGRSHTNWSWRIPFILQAVPPVILMFSVWFIPESPRWLYAQRKEEEALKVLAYFHTRNNDVNSPVVQLELQEIATQISQEGAEKRWWDFRSLFNSRGNTYRFLLGVVNLIWSQFAGNGLITYWLPVLIRDAGITDTDKQRQYTFANSVTSLAGALAGSAIVDHVGRRPLMLWASGSCGVMMAICAGLLSKQDPTNTVRTSAGIAFLMLFMVCFSSGWTPLQGLYPTEVLSFENRLKGQALRQLIGILIGCWNSFALPVLLTRIKWKTYVLFVALNAIGFVVIWAFAVETKQLSLEDLDEVFSSPNPKKTSLRIAKDAKIMAKQELRENSNA